MQKDWKKKLVCEVWEKDRADVYLDMRTNRSYFHALVFHDGADEVFSQSVGDLLWRAVEKGYEFVVLHAHDPSTGLRRPFLVILDEELAEEC